MQADRNDPKVQDLMRFLFSQGGRNDVNIAGNPCRASP